MSKLEEIEARANAATPGPWVIRVSVHGNGDPCDDIIAKEWGNVTVAMGIDERDGADSAFIARARDDVPWLIARVRALEAALGDAADKLEYFGHGMASEYGTSDESEAAFMVPAAAARAVLTGGS